MSKAANVIELAKRSITDLKSDVFAKALDVLPLDQLDDTYRILLFIEFFELCTLAANKTALQILVSTWSRFNVTENLLPFTSYLFMYNSLSTFDLQFYVEAHADDPNVNYEKIIVDYINGPPDPRIELALNRIDAVFPALTNMEYRRLHKLAFDKGADVVTVFLQQRIQDTATPAPKNPWVSLSALSPKGPMNRSEIENLLPDESVVWTQGNIVDKSVDDVIKVLYKAMKRDGINYVTADESIFGSDVYSALRTLYMKSTPEERLELLTPILNGNHRLTFALPAKSDEAKMVFRILGPCNTLMDINLNLDHICAYYGGCRMLSCTCFGTLEADDAEISSFSDVESWRNREWFTGNCGQCNRRIHSRATAVRIPLPDGGWRGCYCSLWCMKEIYTNTDLNVLGDENPLAAIEVVNSLVILVEEQLTKFGIEDRVDE